MRPADGWGGSPHTGGRGDGDRPQPAPVADVLDLERPVSQTVTYVDDVDRSLREPDPEAGRSRRGCLRARAKGANASRPRPS